MKKSLSLAIILALAFTMTFSCVGIANAIATEEMPGLGSDNAPKKVDASLFDYDMSLENGIEITGFDHDTATEDSIEEVKILSAEDVNRPIVVDPRVMTLGDIKADLKDGELSLTAKVVKAKSGKPAVELSFNVNGVAVKLDGIKVYRSTKKNSGYGKTALKTTKNSSYVNTNVKAGKKYYYKAKGYVTVDGKKYYTGYSKKVSVTVSKKKMGKYVKPAPLYDNQLPLAGGYMAAEDTTITDELKTIFEKATKGLDGASYEPIKLMGTQVVAGTNYKFLCKAKGVFPGAIETKKVVTIFYQPWTETCEVSNIEDYE